MSRLELGLFPIEYDTESECLFYTDSDIEFLRSVGAKFCRDRGHFYTTSIEIASRCYKYVNNHNLRAEWRRCFDLNPKQTKLIQTYDELRTLLRKVLLKESVRQQQGITSFPPKKASFF